MKALHSVPLSGRFKDVSYGKAYNCVCGPIWWVESSLHGANTRRHRDRQIKGTSNFSHLPSFFYLCGYEPNSFALLSSDEGEATFCWMCCTNVFSVKENYSCTPDHYWSKKHWLWKYNAGEMVWNTECLFIFFWLCFENADFWTLTWPLVCVCGIVRKLRALFKSFAWGCPISGP